MTETNALGTNALETNATVTGAQVDAKAQTGSDNAQTNALETNSLGTNALGTNSLGTERPDQLPEELWDSKSNNFNTTNLYKEYNSEKTKALELRKQLSKGLQNVPKDVSGYQLNFEEIKNDTTVEVKDNDPGLKAAREAALESGLSGYQFNIFISKYMKSLTDSDEWKKAKSGELNEEQTIEQDKISAAEKVKLVGENHEAVGTSLVNWAKQKVLDGVFSEEDATSLGDIIYDARAMRLFNILKESAKPLRPPVIQGGKNHSLTQEEVNKIMSDPKYKDDKVAHAKVKEYYMANFK